jgi:hypothetical protein
MNSPPKTAARHTAAGTSKTLVRSEQVQSTPNENTCVNAYEFLPLFRCDNLSNSEPESRAHQHREQHRGERGNGLRMRKAILALFTFVCFCLFCFLGLFSWLVCWLDGSSVAIYVQLITKPVNTGTRTPSKIARRSFECFKMLKCK